jgi:hypothetical protein
MYNELMRHTPESNGPPQREIVINRPPGGNRAQLYHGHQARRRSGNETLLSRRKALIIGAVAAAETLALTHAVVTSDNYPRVKPEQPSGTAIQGREGERMESFTVMEELEPEAFFPENPKEVVFKGLEDKPNLKQKFVKKLDEILLPPSDKRSIFSWSIRALFNNPFNRGRDMEPEIKGLMEQSGKFSNLNDAQKDMFLKMTQSVAVIESLAKHEIRPEQRSQIFKENDDNEPQTKEGKKLKQEWLGQVLGIMQITRSTAFEMKRKYNVPDADPETREGNILLGMLYLYDLLKQAKGNFSLAVAMYNLGPGTITGGEDKFEELTGRFPDSYTELIENPEVASAMVNDNIHISSLSDLEDVYRYDAAFVKLHGEKEFFEELQKTA